MFPQLDFGPISVSSYGAFNAAATLTAVLWLMRHRKAMGLTENRFWAAIWFLLAGAVIGAKGLFVLLGWEHYASGRLDFIADFSVGWVFFGGLFGAVIFGVIFARRYGLNFWRGADYFSVAIPLGHAIGRIGCFAAGCCHGAVSQSSWAVVCTHPATLLPAEFKNISLHPVQLYESAGLMVIAGICRWSLFHRQGTDGASFRLYAILYGLLRTALDPFRGDGRPERFIGLSHQQWMAMALVLLFLSWEIRERVTLRKAESLISQTIR